MSIRPDQPASPLTITAMPRYRAQPDHGNAPPLLARSRLRPLTARHCSMPAEPLARDLLGRYLVRHLPAPFAPMHGPAGPPPHAAGGAAGNNTGVRVGAGPAPGLPAASAAVPGSEPLVLRIVETEAYLGRTDPASHTFGGRRTPRTETMYRAGGHAYIYLIYGMHHCLNVVSGPEGHGEAVLIRAGAPVAGAERMAALRGVATAEGSGVANGARTRGVRPGDLAGGPGRLCQALGLDRTLDAVDLLDPASPLQLTEGEPVTDEHEIVRGPRIGIGYAGDAVHWPLRFALRNHPEMSRPRLK